MKKISINNKLFQIITYSLFVINISLLLLTHAPAEFSNIKFLTISNVSNIPVKCLLLREINGSWNLAYEYRHHREILTINPNTESTFQYGGEGIREFKLMCRINGKLLEKRLSGSDRVDTVKTSELNTYAGDYNYFEQIIFSWETILEIAYIIVLYFPFYRVKLKSKFLTIVFYGVNIIGFIITLFLIFEKVKLILFFL